MAVPKGPIQKYTHLNNNIDRGRNQWIKKNFEIFFFAIAPVLESKKGLSDSLLSRSSDRVICGLVERAGVQQEVIDGEFISI